VGAEQPEKLYYSISEVAEMTQVKPHVLRYWEAEFPNLRPKKNRAGNRSYRRKDIDEILAIKRLLYDEGYKIDGARRLLRETEAHEDAVRAGQAGVELRQAHLGKIRHGLQEILDLLKEL